MATGTITGSTSNKYIDSKIEWTSTPSTADNESTVTASLYFRRNNSYSGDPTQGTGSFTISIAGQSGSTSKKFTVPNGGAWTLALTVTKTVSHDANGSKTITISTSGSISGAGLSFSYNGTAKLDNIPRYAKITTFTVAKNDETSLKVTWGCDASCDMIYYSLNGGGFVEANGFPSFYITGLKANTSYSVKIRVRRTDSQLTSDSDAKSQTTYNYPHCISSPNFTLGNPVRLEFYNPLSRSFKFYIIGNGTQIDDEYYCSGTSYYGVNSTITSVPYLYATIPNAQSGKYKVKVVYGSSSITYDNGNTYQIKGTEKPTINGISYKDNASNIVEITGNNQHIVQNQSNLEITCSPATPNYSAGSIKKYVFELNGVTKEKTSAGTVNFGKVNSAQDLDLTVTVTDSRGLSASKTMKIKMLAHSSPTASVTLNRLNNYEDKSYLTVDASISSVDGKNTMSIEYRYRLSTDEYSPFVSIQNNETVTLTLDKNSIFVFNVVVTDAFGTKFDNEFILYKGVFPLFIDTEKNAVGVNEFPAEGEALRVAGGTAHFESVKIGGVMLGDYIVEQGTSGIWRYTKWNSGNVDMECVMSNTSADINQLVEIVIPLPFAVSKIKPYVTCLASGWALTRPPYFNIYGGNSVTDNCVELRLYYEADNANSRAYYFAIQVKGTWR